MTAIRYDAALLAQFPTICGGMVIARGLTNGPTPDALAAAYTAEQAQVRARLNGVGLGDVPSLSAWRTAFRAFGTEPTKYRSAAEALLRRLKKKGDIPGLNLLVDLGNLISIRYAMPLAVFDVRDMTGGITVRLAQGDERFTELGSDAVKHPEPGEVIFADDTGLVFARRWCWRQSAQSASRPDTTDVIITLEGHHADAAAEIEAGLYDLQNLLAAYAGGEVIAAAVLGPDNPALEA
jgi:DNA/RNA-binding domain of Phe-tRNA-synthetase-like protein